MSGRLFRRHRLQLQSEFLPLTASCSRMYNKNLLNSINMDCKQFVRCGAYSPRAQTKTDANTSFDRAQRGNPGDAPGNFRPALEMTHVLLRGPTARHPPTSFAKKTTPMEPKYSPTGASSQSPTARRPQALFPCNGDCTTRARLEPN
jgi:hypothetical protein